MLAAITEQVFIREVLESSKPVLVHFWAPWCGLCRVVEPFLLKLRTESGEQIKVVGINADENLRLANSYRITTLPTILVFQGGELRHRVDCFQRREELRAVLQSMLPTATLVESLSGSLK